jgi:hypothetical protein
MFWGVWIALWILAALPIVTIVERKRKRGEKRYYKESFLLSIGISRVAVTAIVALICLWLCVPDGYMWWIWIGCAMFWTMLEIGFAEFPRVLKVASVAAFLGFLATGVAVGIFAGVNNAIYFNSFIEKSEGFPIQTEVPDNLLRLTTDHLAKYIVLQYMGELGGAVKITGMQLTFYEGRLVWVAVVAKQQAWGATYNTEALVVVDANDPERPPKILKQKFLVAEGLDFNPIIRAWGNAKAKIYYGIDTALTVGDVYPVLTPEGKWVMAATAYKVDWRGVRIYEGLFVFDDGGNIIGKYQIPNLPRYVVQAFDEESFLEGGIGDWGSRRRGDGFDLFARGFLWIPPSPDRVEQTEDLRYIYDPDTNQIVAVVLMHPVRERGEFTLAGVFKITPDGRIRYYDLAKKNVMSGKAASGLVLSKIPARTGTRYFTEMELLYPINTIKGVRYAWFVPIYFESETTKQIGLAGLAIVDAEAPENIIIEYTGQGITGEMLIKKAKEAFKILYGEKPPAPEGLRIVEGALTAKYPPYIKDGNTRIWLVINSTTQGEIRVLIKAELISDEEMLLLQRINVGEKIKVEIDKDNVVKRIIES